MPAVYYGVNLLTYVTFNPKHLNSYVIMFAFMAFSFLFPVIFATHLYMNR